MTKPMKCCGSRPVPPPPAPGAERRQHHGQTEVYRPPGVAVSGPWGAVQLVAPNPQSDGVLNACDMNTLKTRGAPHGLVDPRPTCGGTLARGPLQMFGAVKEAEPLFMGRTNETWRELLE